VSYGWNDAPLAIDRADKEYQPPPEGVVAVQRALSVSRSYRWLMQVLRESEARRHPPNVIGPRVSVDDYVANLRGFVRSGREHGVIVVLLTRPHRDRLDNRDNWRKTVPEYNEALRSLVGLEHVPLIDVQRAAADHPELFIDECHFSTNGHRLAAQFIAQQLAPLLAH